MADRDKLARNWLDQAHADLAAAGDSAATGHHEWACPRPEPTAGLTGPA